MKFNPYQKYKPSGMDWLNSVPEHWSVFPLKRSVQAIKGGVWGEEPQGDDNDLVCIRVADFDRVKLSVCTDRFTVRNISPSEKNGRALAFGDLLLEKSGGGENQPVGCVVRFEQSIPAVCSNFIARLSPSEGALSSYFKYVHTAAYSTRLTVRSINQTSGIQNLDTDKYLAERVPYPPVHEQREIASFLDRETVKIDTLIAKQEKLIELLKEKRQAVISHAVTKGLDPGVPMKPSGVEWLGDVPGHWVRTAIKHLLYAIVDSEHKTAPYQDNGEYLVVRTTNIKDGTLVLDGAKYTDRAGYEEWTQRGVPAVDDILFTREAPAGEACLVPDGLDLCLGQRVVLLKVNREVLDPQFGLWSIYGGLASEFIENLSQGSTVAHFNMSDISNIPVFRPPLDEQKTIVEYLGVTINKIDYLIRKAEKAILLQKEHRTALISAAVTGKIDVREAVTVLQEAA